MPNRNKKKTKQISLVVNEVKKTTQAPKKRRARDRPKKVSAGGGAKNGYLTAITHPFSLAAEGARVPDGCCLPTVPFTVTQKVPIRSDADGDWDFAAFPNLANAALSSRSSLLTSINTVYGEANSSTGVLRGTNIAFDVAALSNQFVQHRIVGWGARLRTTAGLSATGEVTSAILPLKGMLPFTTAYQPAVRSSVSSIDRTLPGYLGTAGPVDSVDQYFRQLGLPFSGSGNGAKIDIAKLITCPVHGTASSSQVAARGLHFRSKPYEPEAAQFKRLGFSATGTDSVDVSVQDVSDYTQQYGVDLSQWKLNGWESIVVGGAGFVPSTNIGTLEVIYHVEATHNPNLASLYRPSISMTPTDPAQRVAAHRQLSAVPHISFSDVVQQGEDYLVGQVEGAVGRLAARGMSGVEGMLARLMSAAV